MSYKELYQSLFDAHVVSPSYIKPPQPPYPKWYDANVQCDYHAGITWHSIENCITFKKLVEKLINMGVVKLDDSSSAGVFTSVTYTKKQLKKGPYQIFALVNLRVF
ncbi:hypothetical protein GOBAR_DD27123 [Gossypium barbadense]|nr:hypothetical protein GOBAR_DD27123 [Gossypium barbadense]